MVTKESLKKYSVNELKKKLITCKNQKDKEVIVEYIDELSEKNNKFIEKLFECEVYKKSDAWLKNNGIAKDIRFNSNIIGHEYKLNELFATMAVFASQSDCTEKRGSVRNSRKVREIFGL